ncbi:MAG: ATP phosphoribosyltransferase regulatory subunit [Candidatus Absconditabacteria bacterium]
MLRVGGFLEYSPQEQFIFDNLKQLISNEYKSFGYANIETPAVERNSVLTAKSGEDASKQIYGLYGLAQGSRDTKEFSLHFDLTIPFARYIIDRSGELVFPFKRSQIQKVWRGERAQRGRFREFYQADVDVVWSTQTNTYTQKYIYYDAEVLFLGYNTLLKVVKYLKIGVLPIVHFNNRNIITGIAKYLFGDESDKIKTFFDSVDNYFKITQDQFVKKLTSIGLDNLQISFVQDLFNEKDLLDKLSSLQNTIDKDEFTKGIEEITSLISTLRKLSLSFGVDYDSAFIFDLRIVRGLDYYTGTVFETYIGNDVGLGSLCSGGRYDNLTSYIDSKYNYGGVGASIGLSRIMSLFVEGVNREGIDSTISDVIFLNFESTFDNILSLYKHYKDSKPNLVLEIFPYSDKIGKQLSYADKKGIKFAVILGENELELGIYKLKNLKTGEEVIKKF